MSGSSSWLERGVRAFNGADYSRAARCFRRALSSGERGAEVRCFLGHALASSGKKREARKIFEGVIRDFPGHFPARAGLAGLALGARRSSGAVEKTDASLLALSPRAADERGQVAAILTTRARALQAGGRLAPAEAFWRRALELQPGGAAAVLGLTEALDLQGKRTEAGRLLRRLSGGEGELSPETRFRILVRGGRYREARELGEAMIDRGLGNKQLWTFWDPWGWGQGSAPGERLRESAVVKRSLRGLKDDPWRRYWAGALLGGEESVREFSQISRFPRKRYGWMFFKAGCGALMVGRPDLAQRWLRKSLAHPARDWRAHAYLGEALACQGKKAAALRELERALSAAPAEDAGKALAWQGGVDLWLGRFSLARKRLERAIALGGQHAHCWLGGAWLKLGKPRRALAVLDETIKLFPQDLEAYVWRAEAKLSLGDPRGALKDLDSAPIGVWRAVLGALSMGDLGNRAGLAREFRKIPGGVVDFSRRRAGLGKESLRTEAGKRDILEACLSLSLGFRREDHGQRIWLRSSSGAQAGGRAPVIEMEAR